MPNNGAELTYLRQSRRLKKPRINRDSIDTVISNIRDD